MPVDPTRRKDGKFGPNNIGKPVGAISATKRIVASVCRRVLEEASEGGDMTVAEDRLRWLIGLKKGRDGKFIVNSAVILDAIKWASDRAYGKAPMIVKTSGIDPGSPEAILLRIAGQPIPGDAGMDDREDDS